MSHRAILVWSPCHATSCHTRQCFTSAAATPLACDLWSCVDLSQLQQPPTVRRNSCHPQSQQRPPCIAKCMWHGSCLLSGWPVDALCPPPAFCQALRLGVCGAVLCRQVGLFRSHHLPPPNPPLPPNPQTPSPAGDFVGMVCIGTDPLTLLGVVCTGAQVG